MAHNLGHTDDPGLALNVNTRGPLLVCFLENIPGYILGVEADQTPALTLPSYPEMHEKNSCV